MQDFERHKRILKESIQGLSEQERNALEALRRRLREQAGPVSLKQGGDALMEKARNLFQQLGPEELELLSRLAGEWETRTRLSDQ
ncbi:MAG: hypothetical protein IMX00_07100 [Limnochordales bacterium]|nr:hypothetical protein [Limnochordales bacterium]